MRIKSLIVSIILTGMMSSSASAQKQVDAIAKKGPESGNVGKKIKLMSRHEVALHNTTDHAMTYHVDYNLCAETIMYPHYHTMMTCVTKKLDVKIESGKEYYNLQPMEGFVFYDRPGTFSVTATTKISNPSHNLVDHTMDAGEINSIHVHY